MTKSKYRDNRDWISEFKEIQRHLVLDKHIKPRILFETPKIYNEEGIAYKGKDGNEEIWLKFNIIYTKNTKTNTLKSSFIIIRSNDQAIKTIVSYIIFLKNIGCDKLMIYYNVYNMVANHFKFIGDVFKATNNNKEIICNKVNYYLDNDCEPSDNMIDNRNFCFKSDVVNKKSKRTTIDNKKRGNETFGKFCELYPKISNKKILSYRLNVSERQIDNLINRYNKENGVK